MGKETHKNFNSEKDAQTVFSAIAPLPPCSLDKLSDNILIEEFPKGHLLFEEGKKDRNIYFIRKGIVRVYHRHEITDVTLLFGIEGDFLISLKSYVEDKPGYETIELLENSTFFRLEYEDLQKLYDQDIHIANWGRKIAEKELIRTEERLISRQFRTASQRYKELIEKHPYLLRRVQLGHIASYLGVSQVTLSRIRAEIK